MRAGDGLCDEAAVAGAGRSRDPRTCVNCSSGARASIATPTADRRSAARRPTACGACCTPATPPAARSAASCGSASRALPPVETIDHALVHGCRRRRRAARRGLRYVDAAGSDRTRCAPAATLLATGGAGQVFRETTNPVGGDRATVSRSRYDAGARVADLEFVQFHPTRARRGGRPRFLISEALRGEGARLVNARGDAFMSALPIRRRSGAARHRCPRHRARGRARPAARVRLTLAHLDPGLRDERFPTIAATSVDIGLDLARDPHSGRTRGALHHGRRRHGRLGPHVAARDCSAAGEVACTGVHGANRLASNSLLEGLVFERARRRAMQEKPQAASLKPDRVGARGLGLAAAASTISASSAPSPEPLTRSRRSAI